MRKFFGIVAGLIIFLEIFSPIVTSAIISTAPVPGGGFSRKPCFDLTSCAITIGIAVFLEVFGSKLKCLFGGDEPGLPDGISIDDLIPDSAYDAIPGVSSLGGKAGFFGGKIAAKFPCKCGKGLGVSEVMVISQPRPAIVAVTRSTKIYKYGSFRDGNWVLGKASNNMACKIPKAVGIDFIGTGK